jgi:hypothetical protein
MQCRLLHVMCFVKRSFDLQLSSSVRCWIFLSLQIPQAAIHSKQVQHNQQAMPSISINIFSLRSQCNTLPHEPRYCTSVWLNLAARAFAANCASRLQRDEQRRDCVPGESIRPDGWISPTHVKEATLAWRVPPRPAPGTARPAIRRRAVAAVPLPQPSTAPPADSVMTVSAWASARVQGRKFREWD